MLQLNAYFGGNAPSKVYERDTVKNLEKHSKKYICKFAVE